jgi:hypothetical protein
VCDAEFVTERNLTFFSQKHFTKQINKVAIHIISLHLLDQIFEEKYINIPHSYGGFIHLLQIFKQKICPLVIQALNSDLCISSETQLQERMAVVLSAILMVVMVMMILMM